MEPRLNELLDRMTGVPRDGTVVRAIEEETTAMTDEVKCPECNGNTVEFRGRGLDMQYRICSRCMEPGHKSSKDVESLIAAQRMLLGPPSRRFA